MTPTIKTKQDLAKALNSRDYQFASSNEVVNDADLRVATDKMKGLLRESKKLQVIVLQRG